MIVGWSQQPGRLGRKFTIHTYDFRFPVSARLGCSGYGINAEGRSRGRGGNFKTFRTLKNAVDLHQSTDWVHACLSKARTGLSEKAGNRKHVGISKLRKAERYGANVRSIVIAWLGVVDGCVAKRAS